MKRFAIILIIFFLNVSDVTVFSATFRDGCRTKLVNSTHYRKKRTPYKRLKGRTIRCDGNCHKRNKKNINACIPKKNYRY